MSAHNVTGFVWWRYRDEYEMFCLHRVCRFAGLRTHTGSPRPSLFWLTVFNLTSLFFSTWSQKIWGICWKFYHNVQKLRCYEVFLGYISIFLKTLPTSPLTSMEKAHRVSRVYKVLDYNLERKQNYLFISTDPPRLLLPTPAFYSYLQHDLSAQCCTVSSVTLFPVQIQDISEESFTRWVT